MAEAYSDSLKQPQAFQVDKDGHTTHENPANLALVSMPRCSSRIPTRRNRRPCPGRTLLLEHLQLDSLAPRTLALHVVDDPRPVPSL